MFRTGRTRRKVATRGSVKRDARDGSSRVDAKTTLERSNARVGKSWHPITRDRTPVDGRYTPRLASRWDRATYRVGVGRQGRVRGVLARVRRPQPVRGGGEPHRRSRRVPVGRGEIGVAAVRHGVRGARHAGRDGGQGPARVHARRRLGGGRRGPGPAPSPSEPAAGVNPRGALATVATGVTGAANPVANRRDSDLTAPDGNSPAPSVGFTTPAHGLRAAHASQDPADTPLATDTDAVRRAIPTRRETRRVAPVDRRSIPRNRVPRFPDASVRAFERRFRVDARRSVSRVSLY